MMIDTPRGYPRLCISGRWAPVCDELQADADNAQCDAYRGKGVTPRNP